MLVVVLVEVLPSRIYIYTTPACHIFSQFNRAMYPFIQMMYLVQQKSFRNGGLSAVVVERSRALICDGFGFFVGALFLPTHNFTSSPDS